MDNIVFYVKGRDPEAYKVTFIKKGDNINALCNCRAGVNGLHCKHRLNILAGKDLNLVSENKEQISIVQSWLPGSDLELAFCDLAEAEHEMDLAKKKVAKAKKLIAISMRS